MLVNSTSSFNDNLIYHCSNTRITIFIVIGMMATKVIVILPLCLFVLYLGFQQWRQQRSLETASHCDVFTYHLSLIELFWGPGCMFYLCGVYINNLAMILLGMSAFSFNFLGQILFHVLTCVERYLAVVHPIIYRMLRKARGIRIRKITIRCVWLFCFGLMILHVDVTATYVTSAVLCIMAFAIIVVTFCSISVLCILIHPGPGEDGGEKPRVTQSKRRAFNIITAILGVLGLWFLGILVSNALSTSSLLRKNISCVVLVSVNWLNLPISLMAPLLYLNRSGKLSCCR